MKTSGHLACPPSRRGHSWREPTEPERQAILYRSAEGLRFEALRICNRCWKPGIINKQGLVTIISWECRGLKPDPNDIRTNIRAGRNGR